MLIHPMFGCSDTMASRIESDQVRSHIEYFNRADTPLELPSVLEETKLWVSDESDAWQSQLFTFYATTHFDTRRIFDDSGGAWSWRSDAEQRSQWNFARGELSRLKLPESCKCGWIDIRYAVCGFTYCQLLSALLLFLFLCWRIKPLFCRRKATPWQIVCGGRVKGRQGSSCWVFREATTPITERIAKNCLCFHLEKEAIQKDHSRCISIVIKTEVVQPEKKNGRQSLSFFLTFMLGNDRHAKTAWGRDAIWTPGRCYPVRFRAFLNAQCR